MKIGNKESKSPKNAATQNKKDPKNSNATTNSVPNNSQLLTLHQQQMIKQENARNLKNQQPQINQQHQQNLQALQQQQQHNKILFANLQHQQQQQQQQQQNRVAITNSSTISNLNPQSNQQTGTLQRQLNGQGSISNSLSTSAINSNIMNTSHILNDNLNRQIITNGPNSIYARTISVQPNQQIYNSSTLNKPMVTNLNKQSIYGQTQLNPQQQQQLNNNIIYATRQNPNLFSVQNQVNVNPHSIYGQAGQFNNSQSNINQNQMNNNRLNLFEEDSGIMSEVETASTGFRRLNKIRSSLPVVRTMSKTSDKSLGLVFLQYNNSTKKSLLPNEITSFDTVNALFVRSFPNQLSMDYFENKDKVRIYLHDQTRDLFYELDDLKDVKDRSILRIYENNNGNWVPAGNLNANQSAINSANSSLNSASTLQRPNSILGFSSNKKDDLNYFSEPEFDNDFNHQLNNLNKQKRYSASFANGHNFLSTNQGSNQPANLINCGNNSQYYGTIVVSAQQRQEALAKQEQLKQKQFNNISSTLPRNTHLNQIMNLNNLNNLNMNNINNMNNMNNLNSLNLNNQQLGNQAPPKPQRTFNMLNNKISYMNGGNPLQQSLNSTNSSLFDKSTNSQQVPDRPYSVAGNYSIDNQFSLPIQMARSFNGNTQFLTSPERKQFLIQQQQKQPNDLFSFNNGPGLAIGNDLLDDQTKIKMKLMEKQLENLTGIVETVLKPSLNQQSQTQQSTILKSKPKQNLSFDLAINGNLINSICSIQNQAKILNNDLKELRKFTIDQTHLFSNYMTQVSNELKNRLSLFELQDKKVQNFRLKRFRLTKEEDQYREDVNKLEKDLTELELNVEKLRANVISRRCRVNMIDVENMAFSLSRSGKTVSLLKEKFPSLQSNLKLIMTKEMQVVVDEEK